MRFGRRLRRFSRRSRRSFRRKSGFGRSRLRGRRFPRGRRGFRRGIRSRRRIQGRGRLGRLRRASRSTRSSGNIGTDYKRVNRRLSGANTLQFPTLGSSNNAIFSIAWYLPSGGLVNRGQVVAGPNDVGPIVSPTALAPGAGGTPVPYNISGYISVTLGSIPQFSGDFFSGYREYRIRSFRVTLRHRAPVYVSTPGTATNTSSSGGSEIMLVNTSKCGQFVMPYPLALQGAAVNTIDDPWVQVENFPNSRNMCVRKITSRSGETILSLKCNAMENYIFRETGVEYVGAPTPAGTLDPSASPFEPFPYQQWVGMNEIGPRISPLCNGLIQVRRRPYRWTKQWVVVRDTAVPGNTPVWAYFRNDFKRAEGIQAMIKGLSYDTASLPYCTMHITAQVEFRGLALVPGYGNAAPTDTLLFPFTNASYLAA